MSKVRVIGTVAGVSLAGGAGLAIWASQTLGAQGAWSPKGVASGHLDFIVATALLVGVALLIAGFVIALAAVAEAWSEAQREARQPEREPARVPAEQPTHPRSAR